jgi:hypothetical protein
VMTCKDCTSCLTEARVEHWACPRVSGVKSAAYFSCPHLVLAPWMVALCSDPVAWSVGKVREGTESLSSTLVNFGDHKRHAHQYVQANM